MAKRSLVILIIGFLIYLMLPLITTFSPFSELSNTAVKYVDQGPEEIGSANLVTAVVVTYRGLDTLGEVTILFIVTAGIGFLLRSGKQISRKVMREGSDILKTGSEILVPLIFLLGIYVFMHGHLTPGGGFQGGVILASGILLIMLTFSEDYLKHGLLNFVESISGTVYLALGIAGLLLAGGFLDNRFLPLGNFGSLLSAGAIPLIYSFIGLKVGSELVGILDKLREHSS